MAEGSRFIQYSAGLCVTLTMIYHGMLLAWPSPVLPKLLGGETNVQITKEQCSWLVALVAIGAIPGSLSAQYLGDIIGRKKTILLLAAPAVIGSTITIFATSPYLMYFARFISGISNSMAVVVVSIYIGEIADKEIRGALGTLMMSMANVGNLIMYSVGPHVSYNFINWMCLSVPILFFLACTWVPESPVFYLKRGSANKAGQAMLRLRSLKDMTLIQKEICELQENITNDMEKKSTIYELLIKKDYRKAVIVLGGVKILQQMTGTLAIQSYLETIFRNTSMHMSGADASLLYGIVQFLAGIMATILVDKMGRKPLLFVSSLGTGISLTSVGVYFYMQNVLKSDQQTMDAISWLPITGIIGFNVLFTIGIGTLPYVLQSELFPTNVKGAASSLATMFGATMAFVSTKVYQNLVDGIGQHMVFWIFAAFSYAGVFFVYFVVPETKGKTLMDIQRKLNRRKKDEETAYSAESLALKT